jgi:hypothetical protein
VQRNLLTDDNHRVIGVRAGSECYYATKGVVIATGDYTAATDLVSAALGGSAGTATAANPDNTGDGHLLGRSVGGVTLGMDSAAESLRYLPRKHRDIIKGMPPAPWFSRLAAPFARHMPRPLFEFMAKGALVGWLAPSPAMYQAGAIQIDAATGRRMTDETKPAELSRSVGKHGDRSYLVFDAKIAREFWRGGQPVAAFPGIARAYRHCCVSRSRDLVAGNSSAEPRCRSSRSRRSEVRPPVSRVQPQPPRDETVRVPASRSSDRLTQQCRPDRSGGLFGQLTN